MKPSGGPAELWRTLAAAQDASLADRRALDDVARALARSGGGRGVRRVRRLRVAVLAGAALAAAAGALWLRAPPLQFQTRGEPGQPGQPLVARADSDLPLRFSDGSVVTFRPGSAGKVQRLTGAGAVVALEEGLLEAHVVHAARTRWTVEAGPFRVHVTGTRFTMSWSRAQRLLTVALHEGSLLVDGALLGAGVPLRAGQRLTAELDSGRVRTEPLIATAGGPAAAVGAPPAGAGGLARQMATAGAPAAAVGSLPAGAGGLARQMATAGGPVAAVGAPPAGAGGPGPPGATAGGPAPAAHPVAAGAESAEPEVRGRGGRATGADWVALAERGEYREALEAAQRPGLMAAMRGLDARGLLTLGDVARYAGAARTAERVFLTLVDRFPGEPPAADAVFSLGRLAFERDRPAEAARWFQRYVSDWSAGPLGDQAAGRLVECHLRAGDRPAARAAARAYLARAPRGTHAPLARKVLAEER